MSVEPGCVKIKDGHHADLTTDPAAVSGVIVNDGIASFGSCGND